MAEAKAGGDTEWEVKQREVKRSKEAKRSNEKRGNAKQREVDAGCEHDVNTKWTQVKM